MEKHKTFREFYPFYLKEHSHRGTRIVHFLGTPLGVVIGVRGIMTGQWYLIPVGIATAYGVLWISHAVFQGNRPTTLSQPIYSFMGDWRMLFDLLTGRENF